MMPLLVLSARTAITTRGGSNEPWVTQLAVKPLHLIALGHTADEHPMRDLAQQDLLGVGVEGADGHRWRMLAGL
jgi:hypothetical protein